MKLLVLGNGSASPSLERAPSSVILEYKNKYFLFDCGESIQYKLLQYKINFNKLTHIYITHLHGDHYAGLFGLLSTLNSWGRDKELTIVAPAGLKEILTVQFKHQNSVLHFQINFIETQNNEFYKVLETKDILLYAFPLSHRVPTTGFLFTQTEQDYKLLKNKLPETIKIAELHLLKKGQNVTDENGNIIYLNSDYAALPEPPKTFAYCTDTIYDETIISYIKGADLVYHEATFLSEHASRATATYHSTAAQAATIAAKADAKNLIIGHFSARYGTIAPFLEEAKAIFENTVLAQQGLEIDI